MSDDLAMRAAREIVNKLIAKEADHPVWQSFSAHVADIIRRVVVEPMERGTDRNGIRMMKILDCGERGKPMSIQVDDEGNVC